MADKKIHPYAIRGQRGVNLIESVVLEMGFAWHPTGQIEAGIDGFIEILDPETGVSSNSIVQVQSKATEQLFITDLAPSFEYVCRARDLAYWMAGNAPVILVVSRPSTREAYWVSIKHYFADPARLKSHKVVFDKTRDRFDTSCRQALINLAVPSDVGLYLAPRPKQEQLYTNLLPVTSYPDRIFVADTPYREAKALWDVANARELSIGGEWILRDKRVYSFYDLREAPWDTLCDRGTVDDFDTEEWAATDDPALRRQFVDLLNRCLAVKARALDLAYYKTRDYYYFRATNNLSRRTIRYKSLTNTVPRSVFEGHKSKTKSDSTAFYRHSAFKGRFRRHNGAWFLEITPTYHFTRDGYHLDLYYQDRLKRIKILERNSALLGQLLMWAFYLGQPAGLFSQQQPLLGLGSLRTIELDAGIDDEAWRNSEEGDEAQTLANVEHAELWGDA